MAHTLPVRLLPDYAAQLARCRCPCPVQTPASSVSRLRPLAVPVSIEHVRSLRLVPVPESRTNRAQLRPPTSELPHLFIRIHARHWPTPAPANLMPSVISALVPKTKQKPKAQISAQSP